VAIEPSPANTPPTQSASTIAPVIDLTDEADDLDTAYPTISELLAELDESMSALGFAQYEERLLAAGFGYVHQLADTPTTRAALESLQVPVGIVEEIIDRAARMTRRAAKSKHVIKNEDGTDHKPEAD